MKYLVEAMCYSQSREIVNIELTKDRGIVYIHRTQEVQQHKVPYKSNMLLIFMSCTIFF